MTASRQFKGLLAGVAAVALIGTAIAQGNPPNPAVKSAPVGAGQQSSQQTPMGTTGTPTGGGTAAAGSTSTTTGAASTSSTAGTASSGTSMGSSTTSADTSMSSGTKKRTVRVARADRN